MNDIDASPAPDKGHLVENCGTSPQGVVDQSGETIALDVMLMLQIGRKIGMEDFGKLSIQIARAAAAKRPSELQRLMLAIVRYNGEVTP